MLPALAGRVPTRSRHTLVFGGVEHVLQRPGLGSVPHGRILQ
jgi:hypothetical protein